MISLLDVALLCGGLLIAYLLLLLALLRVGRGIPTNELVRFAPDCLVLIKRLVRGGELPRRQTAVLLLLVGYLVSPIDLIPDFLPVIGQVDDVLAVALVLRWIMRRAGPNVIRENWPGTPATLALLMRALGDPAPRIERRR